MKTYKIITIMLFLLSAVTSYSQGNKTDSMHMQTERESLNGYFSHNNQFCDKLEQFINIFDSIPGYDARNTPLILISNCKYEKDSFYSVRVEIRDDGYIFAFVESNGNDIYIYGGKLKGRYIFLKQESIFGKLIRSEFNISKHLEEMNPFFRDVFCEKYHKWINEGSITNCLQPYMIMKIDKEGAIIETKYYRYDAFKLYTYNNFKDFNDAYKDFPRIK